MQVEPIGIVHSCFGEKFGTPRQPGLVPSARAVVELLPPCNCREAVEGLEQFSHIWVVFLFHQTAGRPWKATVRPPRLGGNRRLGVFVTRSNYRPNAIGMSAVKLEKVETNNGVRLHISGADIVDGTPVLDIKPYLPYADCIAGARAGFAECAPQPVLAVVFSPEVAAFFAESADRSPLKALLTEALALDPRPAYQADGEDARGYRMILDGCNFTWRVRGETAEVFAVEPVE